MDFIFKPVLFHCCITRAVHWPLWPEFTAATALPASPRPTLRYWAILLLFLLHALMHWNFSHQASERRKCSEWWEEREKNGGGGRGVKGRWCKKGNENDLKLVKMDGRRGGRRRWRRKTVNEKKESCIYIYKKKLLRDDSRPTWLIRTQVSGTDWNRCRKHTKKTIQIITGTKVVIFLLLLLVLLFFSFSCFLSFQCCSAILREMLQPTLCRRGREWMDGGMKRRDGVCAHVCVMGRWSGGLLH